MKNTNTRAHLCFPSMRFPVGIYNSVIVFVLLGAPLVAQMVKNLLTMQTWVWSLGWEDPPEKGMATHSSILAWRIPWTEEPSRPQAKGSRRVRHDWETFNCTFKFITYYYANPATPSPLPALLPKDPDAPLLKETYSSSPLLADSTDELRWMPIELDTVADDAGGRDLVSSL